MIIYPYKYKGMWVFDDEKLALVREPFISGSGKIIDELVKGVPHAEQVFRLIFSASPFPGHHAEFYRLREDGVGSWYRYEPLRIEGCFGLAFLRYFDKVPPKIYAKFENPV